MPNIFFGQQELTQHTKTPHLSVMKIAAADLNHAPNTKPLPHQHNHNGNHRHREQSYLNRQNPTYPSDTNLHVIDAHYAQAKA